MATERKEEEEEEESETSCSSSCCSSAWSKSYTFGIQPVVGEVGGRRRRRRRERRRMQAAATTTMTRFLETDTVSPRFITPALQGMSLGRIPSVDYRGCAIPVRGDTMHRAGVSPSMFHAPSAMQRRVETLESPHQELVTPCFRDPNPSRGFSYFESDGQTPPRNFSGGKVQEHREEHSFAVCDSLDILREYSRQCELASQMQESDDTLWTRNIDHIINKSSAVGNGLPRWTMDGAHGDTPIVSEPGMKSTPNHHGETLLRMKSRDRLGLHANIKSQRGAKMERRSIVPAGAAVKSRQQRADVHSLVRRLATTNMVMGSNLSTTASDNPALSPAHSAPFRLAMLRGRVHPNLAETSPRIERGGKPWSPMKLVSSPSHEDSAQISRIEEIRQHLEKYRAHDNQVAAKPLQLLHEPSMQNLTPREEWPVTGFVRHFDAASPEVMLHGSFAANGVAPAFNGKHKGDSPSHCRLHTRAHSTLTSVNLGVTPLHIVFDTCSLLIATKPSLERMMRHGVVCIPHAVISELDRWNNARQFSGHETKKPKNLPFAARRLRNWMASAVEVGANIRLQRRCEVNVLYNSTVATKDDSILGFAVYLEQEQHIPVEFVTEDKFLRLKAVSELRGNVYNLTEFMQSHHW